MITSFCLLTMRQVQQQQASITEDLKQAACKQVYANAFADLGQQRKVTLWHAVTWRLACWHCMPTAAGAARAHMAQQVNKSTTSAMTHADFKPSKAIWAKRFSFCKLQQAPRQVCPQVIEVGVHGVGPTPEVQIVGEVECVFIEVPLSHLENIAP